MNGPTILISEQRGSLGRTVTYIKADENRIVRLSRPQQFSKSLADRLLDIFRDVFLPHGYPDSVSEDYFEYQVWDTVQAFCSTITGTFTTQAILKGVGVGDANATPLAAAITWVAKDGTGMLGRIVFAWWKGNSLDSDCKKWRLFADIINDSAMFLELLIPYFSSYSMGILCLTTSMKALVGVAGGATRASITQHQAIKGNMADVSAKDGSQETCVNLIASIVGIIFLALANEGQYVWTVFMIFTAIHLIANYFAVGALIFKNVNKLRLHILIQTYLKLGTVTSPLSVNKKESLILGFGKKSKDICGFHIKMGCSLENIPRIVTQEQAANFFSIYEDKMYLIIPNIRKRVLYVAFKQNETPKDVISAYFHAVIYGIALCKYNNISLNLQSKRLLHIATPLLRLDAVIHNIPSRSTNEINNMPMSSLQKFNEYANLEINNFFTALEINGWTVDSHSLELDLWRYTYGGAGEEKSNKKSD